MNFLPIDKQEVLRYLGHRGQEIDEELNKVIDNSIIKCQQISVPRYCYRIFDCSADDEKIKIQNTSLAFKGNNIYKHLKKADKVAVMAATLGVAFDSYVRMLESVSMTQALVMDACGTEYIEKVCDSVEKEIISIADEQGYKTNFRFSPGYGDFPLEQQPEITSLLDTSRKIGLTCTRELVMLPRKSVTAVIGLIKDGQAIENGKSCDECSLKEKCNFRKVGTTCGR